MPLRKEVKPIAELTDQAAREAAIGHIQGPLEIKAPHGTGKTELILSRFCSLVEQKLAWELEIAVTTFSRRAAAEMRERLQLKLGRDVDHLPISTIHSLARSIRSMQAATHKQAFKICDPAQSYHLIRRAMADWQVPETVWPPTLVYELILNARESGQTFDDFLSAPDSPMQCRLALVYQRYEELLAETRVCDFPGLVLDARRLLEQDETLRVALQERYRFLMIDEWQDCSPGQYAFLRQLALDHRNIMVVGAGEPQSIYEWRKANYAELTRGFRADFPETEEILLRDNHRSTAQIIRAAAALFGPRYPELDLVARRGDGERVHDVRVADEQAEAAFVAGEVQRLARQGTPFNEMAVLYRTNEQSLLLERQFMEWRLPYVLSGRQHLYHRQEVRDILAYLSLSRGEDPAALSLIANAPARGLGPVSLRKLKGDQALVTEARLQLATVRAKELGLSAKAVEGIRQLQAVLSDLRQRKTMRPADLIAHTVELTGYRAWLQDELDGETRLQSLRLLTREAEEYGETGEFLSAITQRIAEDMEHPDDEGVVFLTIHAAKGLQFQAVFVVGMEEGQLPYARSIQHGAEASERRLAHVAISRARDRAYLVSAQSRAGHNGRRIYPRPSRYLSLIPKEVVERQVV